MEKTFRLGEILVKRGLLSPEQIANALEIQKTNKEFLGKILIRTGLITAAQLFQALSDQFGIPFMLLNNKDIDWQLVDKFSKTLIIERRCFPIEKNDTTITLAVTNPLDVWIISQVQQQIQNFQIKRVLICDEEMDDLLNKYRQHLRDKIRKLFDK
jgi:type IV pilus assembly protein PilB